MGEFSVAELLESRRGEDLDLWARTINPQFARVLKTIGFDRTWARAEGAYLFDADGNRYLDMLGGFGMYNVGRNNPRVRAALVEALSLDTPGMLAMGTTLLPGLLAEELIGIAARPDRALPLHELRHRGGRGRAEARPRRDRTRARRLVRARLPRPDARRALRERLPRVHRPLPAAPARLQPRPVRRSRRAREGAAARGRRGLPRRADPGEGRAPPAGRLPRGRAGALPPLRDALLPSTRCRPASAGRGACSRSSTGGSSRISFPSRSRSPAATSRSAGCSCRAPSTRRSSTRWSTPSRTARRSRRTSSAMAAGLATLRELAGSGSWRRARAAASCSSS